MLINELIAIGLFVVTGIYATLTFLILRVQNKTRVESFKPMLYAKLDYPQPLIPYIKIVNVGKGSALDVIISISTYPKSKSIQWKTKFLEPNESQGFMLEEITLEKMIKKYEKIIVTVSYRSTLEEEEPITQEIIINLEEEIENLSNSSVMGKWVTDELHHIRRQLEQINLELIRKNY